MHVSYIGEHGGQGGGDVGGATVDGQTRLEAGEVVVQ